MTSYAPELALLWITAGKDRADTNGARSGEDELPSPSQQEALRALAERVNAARSTI